MHSIRMKRRSLALMFLPITIGVSGCTSSGGKSPTATSGVPTLTPTATTIPTATPTTDEIFPNKLVWHFANKRGYTYDLTIALGKPTHIPESGTLTHPLDRDFALDSACTVDPQFDVVIPAYLSAEATTVGFDTPISIRASFTSGGSGISDHKYFGPGVAPYDGDNRIRVAQLFSDGPICKRFDSTTTFSYGSYDTFGVQWENPIPNGSIRTHKFFIVVKDYFTPATPNGDPVLLSWIVLKAVPGGDFDDAAMLYREVGSGEGISATKRGITLSGKVTGS